MALQKSAWEKIRKEAAAKDSHVHEDVDITMLAGKVGNIGFDKKMIMLTSARRMKKRGISPLIATVLIIGFTIVLAALVMQWGSGLFENIRAGSEERAEKALSII